MIRIATSKIEVIFHVGPILVIANIGISEVRITGHHLQEFITIATPMTGTVFFMVAIESKETDIKVNRAFLIKVFNRRCIDYRNRFTSCLYWFITCESTKQRKGNGYIFKYSHIDLLF